MNDEDREALAKAYRIGSGQPIFPPALEAIVLVTDAIARRRAAAVLRAAAQEQRNEAGNVPDTDEGTHADGHRCAAEFLDRRAERLAHHEAAL